MTCFMLVAWVSRVRLHGFMRVETGQVLVALFNGASFGTGSLLFATLFHPPVLPLMSDHALWIGVAGAAAMVASFSGLLPKNPENPQTPNMDGGFY